MRDVISKPVRHSWRRAACLTVAVLSLGVTPGTRGAAGSDDYARGVQAARAGEYAVALSHFEAAQRAGHRDPGLLYNLGVVNYHLGRFAAARTSFITLTDHPRWQGLAYYNLGLIAEAAGEIDEAHVNYQRARELAAQPKLRQLASSRLEPGSGPAQAPPPRWHGLASIGSGYDDNVMLGADHLVDTVSNKGDHFVEFLGAAAQPVAGWHEDVAPGSSAAATSRTAGWAVNAAGYYRAYSDLDDYDFGALSASLKWKSAPGEWNWSTGVLGAAQFAGGDPYANVVTHRLDAAHGSGTRVRATNDLSYLFGRSSYDYVTGWRNRTTVQLEAGDAGMRTRVGYELEFNDRKDLSREPQFFSYSPLRQTLFGAVESTVTPPLRVEVEAAYRHSDYEDDNRFVDDAGNVVEAPRDQDITTVGVRASYALAGQWNLWSQLEHITSRSDVDTYDYDSTRYMLGVERLF